MLNDFAFQCRLTKDPELRRTHTGISVCTVKVAIARDTKDPETGKNGVDYFDLVAWKGTGEILTKFCKKGQLIVCHAKVQNRVWKDNLGQNRYKTELIASEIYFLNDKNDREKEAKPDHSTHGYAENILGDPVPEFEGNFQPLEMDDFEMPF